jgi:NDP-sugar pyrophosphorylase family protein
MRAVILAGGKGTRLRPLTDTRPKPLVPFMGEPYAAGLLRRLAEVGVDRVSFLIAQDPEPFAALDLVARTLRMEVEALTEEVPLDTAGAARRLLREHDDGPVLVCNGDVLTDLDLGGLVATHVDAGARATIALTRVEDTSSFGVVVCDEARRVQRFVEKPAPGTIADDTVNAGTYVLSPGAFDGFPGDGPLSFERDVFPGLLEAGEVVLGYPDDAHWADLGTPQRYLDGTMAVLEGRCEWPPAPGMVATGTSAQAHAEAEVEGADLGAGVVVGRGCVVAPGVRLTDTVLFDEVEVGPEAVLDGAIVGEGAVIGRGARLGPGTVVADGERVPPGAVLPEPA